MDNYSSNATTQHQQIFHRIKFSLFITFQIPACILSVLIYYFFLKNTHLLRNLQNQALLILLLVNFIQLALTLPLTLHFYSVSTIIPPNLIFCRWWIFIEFTLYVISLYLMATISVQRHILIFHVVLLRTKRSRYLVYYAPLLLSILYPLVFYLVTILFYLCDETQYDFSKNLCGAIPCYAVVNANLETIDSLINYVLPALVNALANILLFVRVLWHKSRHNRSMTWKSQRKMAIQLFCISMLYLLCWSPCIIVSLVRSLRDPHFLVDIQENYLFDLVYLVCLFLPWIYLGLIPELTAWLTKARLCRRQQIGTCLSLHWFLDHFFENNKDCVDFAVCTGIHVLNQSFTLTSFVVLYIELNVFSDKNCFSKQLWLRYFCTPSLSSLIYSRCRIAYRP